MKPAHAASLRTLCIAIHDVAPATWPQCRRLLVMLDDLGATASTLLVVPDYHRRGRIDADRNFVRAIDARIARGDEVALHGYFHLDDGAHSSNPLQWARRRLLTAGEGEFAALPMEEACARLVGGLALFDRLGWHARGFVAPAWLLGSGARAALAHTPLRYTSTHTHLELLTEGRRIVAPAISASVRSAWRRWSSRRWLALAGRMTAKTPLLRVALHPADALHSDILDAWRVLLRTLLADRTAATKSVAIAMHA